MVPVEDHATASPGSRWVFFGANALPNDPVARDHERRGRRWLVVSYVFCPCHLPVTLAVLGVVFGGTTLGAALTGSAWRVGAALTVVYALVLWRGFRQIRIAKRLEAEGLTVRCSATGCDIASDGHTTLAVPATAEVPRSHGAEGPRFQAHEVG